MEEYKTTGRKGETVYAVEYDGHEYKRYPNGKHPNYYVFKWKCGGTYHQELLHHAVWKTHNGDIPKGKVIHHIDGNPLNNDISNLMAVTISEHAILHDKLKGFQTKENAEKVWYSKENWKERRKKAIENLQKETRVCKHCGREFVATNVHQRFCSKQCHHKWQYQAEENLVPMVCQNCGKEFMGNKYLKPKCCSQTCAVELAHRKTKEPMAYRQG